MDKIYNRLAEDANVAPTSQGPRTKKELLHASKIIRATSGAYTSAQYSQYFDLQRLHQIQQTVAERLVDNQIESQTLKKFLSIKDEVESAGIPIDFNYFSDDFYEDNRSDGISLFWLENNSPREVKLYADNTLIKDGVTVEER